MTETKAPPTWRSRLPTWLARAFGLWLVVGILVIAQACTLYRLSEVAEDARGASWRGGNAEAAANNARRAVQDLEHTVRRLSSRVDGVSRVADSANQMAREHVHPSR